MKKILFSLSIVCFVVIVGCKSESKPEKKEELIDQAVKMGTLNVGNQNYTVDVPTGWTAKDTTISNVKMYMLISPEAADGRGASMNLLNESMQGLSFDEYMASTIKTMETYMTNMVTLNKGEIEAGDLKGRWFTYKMESSGTKVDGINYTIPKDSIAYIISGSTPGGQMDKYKSIFDAVAKSFKFKD